MPTVAINATAPGPTPIHVTGSYTVAPNTLMGMGYQIGSGAMKPIPPGNIDTAARNWFIDLQNADCPAPGQYLLTVYAGDNTNQLGSNFQTITRQ